MNRQNSTTSISTPGPPGHPGAPLGYPQGPYGNPNVNPGGLSTLGGPPAGSLPGPGTPMPGSMQNGPMPGGMPGSTIPGGGPGMYYTTAPGAGRGIPLGPGGVPMQQGMGRGGIVVNGQPGPPGTMQARYTTGPIPIQRMQNGMGMPAGMPMSRGGPGGPMIGMNVGVGPGGQLAPTIRMTRPVSLQPTHPQYAQFSQPPPSSGMGSMPTGGQPHMLIPQPPTSIQPGTSGQPGSMGQPGGGGQPPPPGGQGRGQPVFPQQMTVGQMNAAHLAQQLGRTPIGNAMTMAAGPMGSVAPPPQRPPSVQQTPQTQPLQPQLTGGGQPGQQMQMGPPMSGGQPMMGLTSTPMGMNPMAFMPGGGGASPQRNSSPHPNSGRGSAAGTPAAQPTPQRRDTPANASSPYASGRPPTPNNRTTPSTQPLTFPSHQTPRISHQDAMMLPNSQPSPQMMHRTVQQGPPGSQINASVIRTTPAQMVEQVQELYAPGGGGPGPGPGPGYTIMAYPTQPGQQQRFHPGLQRMNPPQTGPMGAPPTPLQPQHTGPGPAPLQPQHTGPGPGPGQGPHPPPPLQPQHTGGSMHDQPMQSLQPQHTGGGGGGPGQQPHTPQQQQQQPPSALVPQHTGGSMHGDTVMGPPPGPGRGSVPSTPRTMAARPAGPGVMGPPPPGMIMTPMGMMPPGAMPMGGYPMHMSNDIGAPPQQGMNMGGMNAGLGPAMRDMSSEMDNVNDSTMTGMGIVGHGTEGMRKHAFGTLRLLRFSHHLGNVKGYDVDQWATILSEHFTDTATFSFRAFKEMGVSKNTFVKLPYNLIVRFFETLTQSSINRMSLVLDGVTEHQDGQDYIVYCPQARWPMYYENGYVIELHGVLKARCRTVPLLSSSSESGTPPFQEALPPGQPMKTEPSSNLGTPPSNNPANTDTRRSPNSKMDVDVKPNGSSSSSSVAKMPYIVKIEELCFDNEGMRKYIDMTSRPSESEVSGPTAVQQPDRTQPFELPTEPANMYGMPQLTMRMLELAEGSEALVPLMGWAHQKKTTPIFAIHDFVQHFNTMRHPLQGMVQPPTQPPIMSVMSIPFGANMPMFPPGMAPPGFSFLPAAGGPPPGSQHPSDLVQGSLPEADIAYSTLPMDTISRPPTASMTINPSTLSNNGPMAGMVNGPPGSSNAAGGPASSSAPSSTSAPSMSPTLSTKVPNKRGTMPSSPTKGGADKEKSGTKRRNTSEAGEPASKRRVGARKQKP